MNIQIRWTKGTGPGGQHKNKVETCCVMTDLDTGITVKVDGRSRTSNEKEARKLLAKKVQEAAAAAEAEKRKARRDAKIKETDRIRTYDYTKGIVTDHRTGKQATIKEVVEKGHIEKLR